jgi:hypothetical protein
MNNTNPFHPEVYNTYLKASKLIPSKNEAAHAIMRITSMDLFQCDWSIYAGMILCYLNGSGIKGKETLDDAIEGDDLNSVPFDKVVAFLETHTETYYVEPIDNGIDLNDLNENQWYQAGI